MHALTANPAIKNITTTCLLLLFAISAASGQVVVMDLNGFRIGQFRETATNEFGAPAQSGKFDDGFEYEFFIITPDTSLYMVFEYAAGYTDVIWSIQISGSNPTADIGFKGLRMGADKEEVLRVLGQPAEKENIGKYGERWNYNKANYSVEISKSGKLSSVKIKNNYSTQAPDITKLPTFADVVKALNAPANGDIANILSPDMEINYKGQSMIFHKSLQTEIKTDASKIFETIREIRVGLDQVNTADPGSYEENIRLVKKEHTKHVIKIKTGHAVKEIVLTYINGTYYIWEISVR
ncbi:MAG: hypothetical protein SF053_14745 [Bacteroidia bacterium]|nr:hypothetical protein [Bacteroidia bacterium]